LENLHKKVRKKKMKQTKAVEEGMKHYNQYRLDGYHDFQLIIQSLNVTDQSARADEREKIKKLMHYSEHYKEKVLFEDDLKELR